MGAFIAQHTGDEAHDGLGDNQHCYFPTDEHIITDGYLAHAVAVMRIINYSLVDAFVTPARKDDVLFVRPRAGIVLRKRFSRGRWHQRSEEHTSELQSRG